MLTDSEIRTLGYESGLLLRQGTTYTKWRDGIDIDYPVLEVELFARAVEAAAYAKAEQVVKALHAKISDPLVIGECADAGHNTLDAAEAVIRALAQAKEAK